MLEQIKPEILQESNRIVFSGLSSADSNTSIPSEVADGMDIPVVPEYTFEDVLSILPKAKKGELRSHNDFIDEDGSVDRSEIRRVFEENETLGSPDDLDISFPSTDQERFRPVPEYQEIIDERRKALDALFPDQDIRYRWQVASPRYTIIKPQVVYEAAAETFANNDEGSNVFGWVDLRDYGGRVEITMLLKSQTYYPPTEAEAAEDGNEATLDETRDTDREPIYMGLVTGYSFDSTSKIYAERFGYDGEHQIRLYGLGGRNERKHQGNITDDEYEKEHGRIPISEWWDNGYNGIVCDLTRVDKTIFDISKRFIDFSIREFDIADFYRYLKLPDTYAEAAASLASKHSSEDIVSLWSLYIAMMQTLKNEFTGDRTATTFRSHVATINKLRTNPQQQLNIVENEHQRQKSKNDDEGAGEDEEIPLRSLTDDIDEIEGVTERDLSLKDRENISEALQQQLTDY